MHPGAFETQAPQKCVRVPTVGIVGGGQLARMMALAGRALGIGIVILDPDPTGPAAQVTDRTLTGELDNLDDLRALAKRTDLITFENEWVAPALLAQLESEGFQVLPGSRTLERIQDKFDQRRFLAEAGLLVPAFAATESPRAVEEFAQLHGWPVVLKMRSQGYDGHGVRIVSSQEQLAEAWAELAHRPLLVEAFVPFERELAVMVARSARGEVRTYPVVESRQQGQVCHTVIAPAPVPEAVLERAAAAATAAIERLGGVGVFGVELFLAGDGAVLVNEIAPRPHNTGHYTIDACKTSQFEQHLRAVLGWPLGSTAMNAPAAVMVNILAESDAEVVHPDLGAALAFEDVKLHWYGKHSARIGRKLGHLTTTDVCWQVALDRTLQARRVLAV